MTLQTKSVFNRKEISFSHTITQNLNTLDERQNEKIDTTEASNFYQYL